MRPEVKEIIDWAVAHGWTYEGKPGGHHKIRWTDGTLYSLPSTPSEYRSLKNAKAELERITGAKFPRQKAGKLRHLGRRRPRFDMAAALEERDERRAAEESASALHEEHAQLSAQIAEMRASATPDMQRALGLISRCLRIETECRALKVPVAAPIKSLVEKGP